MISMKTQDEISIGTGVEKTTDDDLERLRPEKAVERNIVEPDQDRLHKRGIQRMMVMDVRKESGSER